jgi:probable rRNA maturation factor
MYSIEIADSQTHLNVDPQELESIARIVLQAEEVAVAELSLAIVDNPTIRALNRQYLGHDYDTDVLSFLLDCEPPDDADTSATASHAPRGRGQRIEGEVIVSAEMAVQSAGKFSWSARQELLLYVIHGILHLTGYDDLSDAERQVMRAREHDMLQLCGLVAADRTGDSQRPPIHPREEPPSGSDSGSGPASDDEGDRPPWLQSEPQSEPQSGLESGSHFSPRPNHQEGA